MSKRNRLITVFMACLVVLALLVVSCAAPTQPTAQTATQASEKPIEKPAATKAAETPVAKDSKPAAPESKPAADQKPGSMLTLNVGHLSITSDAGIYIGIEKGYFKEQGLELKLENFKTAGDQIPLLATGKLDIGGGAVNAGLFNAISRDIPMKIVAEKGSAFPGRSASALVIRKDLVDSGQFKDYADLKGKTIAVSSTDSAPHIELLKALEKGKLKESDVKIITMGFPDMNTAFANKAIDAAMFQEPLTSQAIEKGLIVRWKESADLYPNHTVGVVLYSPKFMSEHPDAAKKYMVAYLKGVRDYNDVFVKKDAKLKAEVLSILTKYTNVKDPAVLERAMPSGLNSDGYVYTEGIAADQDWYVARGLVKQKQEINDIVDNQYVDYAISVLGKAK